MFSNSVLYPTSAVPDLLFRAGCDVGAKLQCPDELTAQEMVAIVSTAVQSIIQVDVPVFGLSPTNLWYLTVAESGEGKDAVRGMLTAGLKRFFDEVEDRYRDDFVSYSAEMDTWRAEREGLKKHLARLAASGEDFEEIKQIAKSHHLVKPVAPMPHCYCLEEFDKKALVKSLATRSKFVLIDSTEGATVLNRQTAKNAHWITKLYSGDAMSFSEGAPNLRTYSVHGALATMSLMIQPKLFSDLLADYKNLLIGGGFLPRFLPAYPLSQRGRRFLVDGQTYNSEGVNAFSQRVYDVLCESPYFKNRSVNRITMVLSPRARPLWFEVRNAIEASMAPGGGMFSVPEFASRLANNVARMAANFQYFQHGNAEISAETLSATIEICKWHALEFVRILSDEAQMPEPEQDAVLLEAWLQRWCQQRNVFLWPLVQLSRYVKRPLRRKDRLMPALQILAGQGKVSMVKDEFGEGVQLNHNHFRSMPLGFHQRPLLQRI